MKSSTSIEDICKDIYSLTVIQENCIRNYNILTAKINQSTVINSKELIETVKAQIESQKNLLNLAISLSILKRQKDCSCASKPKTKRADIFYCIRKY